MRRRRANPDQAELPLVRSDEAERGEQKTGEHAPQCRCPRCQGWTDVAAVRRAAEAALARRRERQRAKALALQLELAEDEKRTDAYLRHQAEVVERVRRDPRLDALLRSRQAGKPVSEALAEVERRFDF